MKNKLIAASAFLLGLFACLVAVGRPAPASVTPTVPYVQSGPGLVSVNDANWAVTAVSADTVANAVTVVFRSGTGITTGPTSTTSGDCAEFTGTGGQIADTGSACGGGSTTAAQIDAAGPITNSTSGNAATATALAATPSQCTGGQFATGVQASGNANCATLPATNSIAYWVPSGSAGTSATLTANKEYLSCFSVPQNIASLGDVTINVATLDSNTSDYYSYGLFNQATGAAVCTTTAQNMLSTGNVTLACSQGAAALPAGTYCGGMTGNATTAVFRSVSAPVLYTNSSFTGTTGGAQPASITSPTITPAFASVYIWAVMLGP